MVHPVHSHGSDKPERRTRRNREANPAACDFPAASGQWHSSFLEKASSGDLLAGIIWLCAGYKNAPFDNNPDSLPLLSGLASWQSYTGDPLSVMSDQLNGTQQTPMDPEKGTLDPVPQLSYNPDVKATIEVFPNSKEKDSGVVTTTKEVVVAAKPKPAPKPRKKVSKWILWKIWFNTYR